MGSASNAGKGFPSSDWIQCCAASEQQPGLAADSGVGSTCHLIEQKTLLLLVALVSASFLASSFHLDHPTTTPQCGSRCAKNPAPSLLEPPPFPPE